MAQAAFSEEYEVIKANLPRLIDKVFPDDISDHLYSLGIISEEDYDASFDRSSTRKDRSRELIKIVLTAVKRDKTVFHKFCSVLLETSKTSVSDLARQLQEDLDAALARSKATQDEGSTSELTGQGIEISTSSASFIQLKQELELLRKSLLQSDENVDAKQSLIKEFVSRFIRNSLESGQQISSIRSSLKTLCMKDMLIPQNLQQWCFAELSKQYQIHQLSIPTTAEDQDVSNSGPPPLFSKSNVYHALYVSTAVASYNSYKYESYFQKQPHEFEEVSMSDSESKIDRYLLARKDKTLFVAFNGEPNLSSWQQKYQTLDQGICTQNERIPIRFFVEYLRNEGGHQLIFTGFSFGASLAAAVYAELWNQTCLTVRDLEENVACIGFGAPLFIISSIQSQISEHQGLQDNARFFYLEDDLLPRLFQCADFPKPEKPDTSSSASTNMLYTGTISGDALGFLSEIQRNFNRKKSRVLTDDYIKSFKKSLQAAIPSTQVKVPVYGYVCNVYHDQDVIKISEPLADADNLQYPNVALIESLDPNDLYNKHSIGHYQSAINNSLLQSNSNEPLYKSPIKQAPPLKMFDLKPEVTKAKFFRHADEVAIVLEGLNLWFCHEILVGSRKETRITINPKGQETTNRSIIFNYTPKKEDDLLISHKSSKVTITLYSHFCKPITKHDIPAEIMDDYTISFRQRQLAKLTPLEVIKLSLLSAILEKSGSSSSDNSSSKLFQTICQFLEDVTRIVPVESISNAIEWESKENAWKCAEALFDSEFIPPKSSILFFDSLLYGCLRLKSGIPSDILRKVQNETAARLYEEQRLMFPVESTIEVSSEQKEVVFTATASQINEPFDIFRAGFRHGHMKHSRMSLPISEPTYSAGSKHYKIMQHLNFVLSSLRQKQQQERHFNVICDANIVEIYPMKANQQKSNCLRPPIDFLKETKLKLSELQAKAQKEVSELSYVLDDTDNRKEDIGHYNEEMVHILNDAMSQDLAICLSLLGAFMQQQIKVPFVNSLSETAHVLQTTESSSAVGVWTLFSLDMLDLRSLLQVRKGKLCIEVTKYVEGILNQREDQRLRRSPDRGGYAGKLQFLMVSMGRETVSCNSQYISYSLERQLQKLCKKFKIKPSTRVQHITDNWDKKFSKSILLYVIPQFRPLLARWLLWSLNIHKLREELASHTTIGIVGLSNSGKSCLVKKLFNQETISGTGRIQRTTIPFIYNLEGVVDGLSIADFPGVDDKDKSVVEISKIILQLSQIIILVIDYRRISTQSAMEWIQQLDRSGVPVLLCLTHGDKLYADECIRVYGDHCTIEMAKRIIGREFEDIKKPLSTCPTRSVILCSFSQDSDSILNSEEGRQKLSDIGIVSQDYVGQWLVGKLKNFQKEMAEKLYEYLTKEHKSGNNLDTGHRKSIGSEMQMPKLLHEATIYGEKAIEISKIDSEYQYIDWKEYGIKIIIPPSALENKATYTIALKAVQINSKHYILPSNSEVVSAFFWIFSSRKFLTPVDLYINHCARLEDKIALSRMSIVSARCDQELPYRFRKCTSEFQLNSRKGLVSTRHFSFFTIIRDFLSVALGYQEELALSHETYYAYMAFGRKAPKLRNVWQFDLFFIKDIEAIKEKINKNHWKDHWVDDTPATMFDFEEEAEGVVLSHPTEQFDGWKIRFKPPSKMIKKDLIDKTFEDTSQQYCRIVFQWIGDGSPQPIDYTIVLEGLVSSPRVELSVPIDVDEPAVIPHPATIHPVPNAQVIIQNNPTITVAPDIKINTEET